MNGRLRNFGLILGAASLLPLALLATACEDDSNTTSNSGGSSSTTSVGGSGGSGGAGGSGGSGGTAGMGGAGGSGGGGGAGAGPPSAADCSPPTGTPGALTLTEVAAVNGALLVTAPWGDDERVFIVAQAGRIHLLKNGVVTEFLDITGKVSSGGERGLLGLAFHPDYVNNGRFFVHYSDNSGGDTLIAEYRRDPNDPDVADPAPVVEPMMEVNQPFGNHNGGSVEFNPVDGMLYIGLGDGGSADDPLNSGQDTTTLLGALLRIDVDNGAPYTVPAGNISDANAAPEIYDWGLRNPYRFSFDVCTGDRYIGDVGQNIYEEIDVAAADDGNKNWGWNTMEGAHCFQSGSCDMTGLALPAVEYTHADGCSVTGGNVYRGSAIPWLRGAYLYGDYCSSKVWMLRWEGGQVIEDMEITADLPNLGNQGIVGFGQDNAGEVYFVHRQGGPDVIYRLDPG